MRMEVQAFKVQKKGSVYQAVVGVLEKTGVEV